MSTIIIGDLHFRSEEPFYSSSVAFCKWFVSQSFNNPDNNAIFLGDIVNSAKSNGKVNYLMVNLFFNYLKFKNIWILQGNHDYSKRDGSGLDPLKAKDNIVLINILQEFLVNEKKCLFLPYFYPVSLMKETYENFNSNIKYDYIFYHFDDETIFFGGKARGINISHLKGKRIGGHIHKKQNNYLGSVSIVRADERKKGSFLYHLEKDEYICIPTFLDYVIIDYSKGLNVENESSAPYIIYDIINAPSKELAEEKFKDYYRGKISTKKNIQIESSSSKAGKKKSIKEYFKEFLQLNNIDEKLSVILLEVLENAS